MIDLVIPLIALTGLASGYGAYARARALKAEQRLAKISLITESLSIAHREETAQGWQDCCDHLDSVWRATVSADPIDTKYLVLVGIAYDTAKNHLAEMKAKGEE
jgi:hypothetical protein